MIYLVVFAVMTFLVAAMSIGVMMGRKPLTGSCGGVGKALGQDNYVCDLCGGDEDKCDEINGSDSRSVSELGYDASKK